MVKKILWVGEAPNLNTGYGVYANNVLRYLASLGKYHIVQLAVYGKHDTNYSQFPWQIIPVEPPKDTPEHVDFKSKHENQFGLYNFDKICAEFKPDVVCNIADIWMFEFILRSHYAKYYKTIMMPTCDAAPQPKQWSEIYTKCDRIFAYNDWAINELKTRLGERRDIVVESAPPVASSEYFPKSKYNLRRKMGLSTHETIFGTVMRNQKRKLFPELFEAFSNFLKYADGKLICHTSYPDKGWDFQALLKQYNLSSQVLFTYKCVKCNSFSLDSFNAIIKECPSCHDTTMKLCNVDDGISNNDLSILYNVMDLYIQPCTNEGFGMPLVEAAACGTRICATNYSAPIDILKKLNGIPLGYVTNTEAESGMKKAVVSHEDITKVMLQVYNTPKEILDIDGDKTRKLFEEHYASWKNTGEKWEKQIDSLAGEWNTPISILRPNTEIPEGIESAYDISTWIIKNTLGDDSKLFTLMHARLARDLALGITRKTMGHEYDHEVSAMQMHHENLSVKDYINIFANKRAYMNECEQARSI